MSNLSDIEACVRLKKGLDLSLTLIGHRQYIEWTCLLHVDLRKDTRKAHVWKRLDYVVKIC